MNKETQQMRQSYAEKLLKKEAGSLKKPMLLISAVMYAVLTVVVIYGAGNHVYDGFGAAAPWIVGGVFVLMSILRLAEFLRSMKEYKVVKDYLEDRRAVRQAQSARERQRPNGRGW